MSDAFAQVRAQVVGEGVVFQGPYGPRRVTYADHAATGRAYAPIEQSITSDVLPWLGNTHSETSRVAAQTTAFREEARRAVRDAFGCVEEDVCIFTGNGATGAIHTLIGCLGLAIPCCLKDVADVRLIGYERPVVLMDPAAHHSLALPLRECELDVEVVDPCPAGVDTGVDLDDLERRLRAHKGRRRIGAFSAASNVTGRLTDVAAVADCLHRYGALAVFDYAAAAPYVDFSMSGASPIDAAFVSMHKFLGGPGAPGVLLAKQKLFKNGVPSTPGGGTVSYVSSTKHRYVRDVEHREEGGTPNIVGAIRAGLAVQLKGAQPPGSIRTHESEAAELTIAAFRYEPDIAVLGDLDAPRLGTVSLLVSHADAASGQRKFLHHNFVVALLNDLFGIQARGGNSCAGPYSHRLLGLSGASEAAVEAAVEEGWQGVKPGWTRVSYGWYDSEDTLNFIISAVRWIARRGYQLLDDYDFDPRTGSWSRRGYAPALLSLSSSAVGVAVAPEAVRWGYVEEADALASAGRASAGVRPTPFEGLRWFWLPGELGG